MTATPRIAPLARAEWTEEARDVFHIVDAHDRRETGSLSNLVMTMAHHPPLAKSFYGFGSRLLLASTLPDRTRELATLRVAWRRQAEYEWVHHTRFARQLGVSDAELAAIRQGPEAPGWSDHDRALLRAVDQLCDSGRIDDTTWDALSVDYDRRQLMDLVFTVGHYVTLAMALATFGVELEEIFRTEDTLA